MGSSITKVNFWGKMTKYLGQLLAWTLLILTLPACTQVTRP